MNKVQEENPFIASTAKDYDLDYLEVARIYQNYPDTFYEKLEEIIKDRKIDFKALFENSKLFKPKDKPTEK